MIIDKINENFPKLKKGDIISVICPLTYETLTNCKVLKVWYPKKGDIWNETEETKNIGLYNSDPDKMFPQIIVRTPTNKYLCMFGNDTGSIISIEHI